MNKKIIIQIIVILIIIVGVGVYFIFQKFAPERDRCGDGICDSVEKANPNLCPKDCGQPSTISAAEDSPFGIFGVFDANECSQFKKDMGFTNYDYYEWAGEHSQNLGAKWSRQNTLLIWGLVEPELGKGYDWTAKGGEEVIENAYKYGGSGFNLVLVIDPDRYESKGKITNEDAFKNFAKAAVEKYGDKVKYWQAYNEPFPSWSGVDGTADSYIEFLRLMSEAVKEADPQAKIILGAEISNGKTLSNGIKAVISKLNGEKVFDVVDLHYWGYADDWKLLAANELRSLLDSNGYTNVEIWSMEHGTYTNQPNKDGVPIEFQSEKDQAISLIKRYVYNLANDVDKIFWNKIVEFSCFSGKCGGLFDNIGLISDGRNSGETLATLGVPRLSYYTYKKMTETLEGSDWNNIQTIQESDGIYIYKFTKNNKPIWVAWNDNPEEKQVTISGISSSQVKITEAIPKYESGKEVTDYNTAFNTETKSVSGGEVTVTLKDKPVFVEEK